MTRAVRLSLGKHEQNKSFQKEKEGGRERTMGEIEEEFDKKTMKKMGKRRNREGI